MAEARDWIASPGGALHGTLAIPGDKSISHRAVMLAAIADGRSRIHGFLEAADTRATAAIFGRLGVRIEAPSECVRIVHGVGIDGLRGAEPPMPDVDAPFAADFAFQLGMRTPVVAVVNGAAAGVGLVIACFADIRFAVSGAKLTTAAPKLSALAARSTGSLRSVSR